MSAAKRIRPATIRAATIAAIAGASPKQIARDLGIRVSSAERILRDAGWPDIRALRVAVALPEELPDDDAEAARIVEMSRQLPHLARRDFGLLFDMTGRMSRRRLRGLVHVLAMLVEEDVNAAKVIGRYVGDRTEIVRDYSVDFTALGIPDRSAR